MSPTVTWTPSTMYGVSDHLRACSHTSAWCFGPWYSGLGYPSMTTPPSSSMLTCVTLPSSVGPSPRFLGAERLRDPVRRATGIFVGQHRDDALFRHEALPFVVVRLMINYIGEVSLDNTYVVRYPTCC